MRGRKSEAKEEYKINEAWIFVWNGINDNLSTNFLIGSLSVDNLVYEVAIIKITEFVPFLHVVESKDLLLFPINAPDSVSVMKQ